MSGEDAGVKPQKQQRLPKVLFLLLLLHKMLKVKMSE